MTEGERALKAQIDALVGQVEQLRGQLAEARLAQAPTMKARLRCPACGVSRIAHATHVLDRGEGDRENKLGFAEEGWWKPKLIGQLEAFACTGCGFVEWYTTDPGGLREVKGQLVILDGETKESPPYR